MLTFTVWQSYMPTTIQEVHDVIGVYELSDSKLDPSQITYIGSGKLRTELKKYLRETCTGFSIYFRYETFNSFRLAQEKERFLLCEFKENFGRLPRCNRLIDKKFGEQIINV